VPTSIITPYFFTGRMPFLPTNQQRQSTEGKLIYLTEPKKEKKVTNKTEMLRRNGLVKKLVESVLIVSE